MLIIINKIKKQKVMDVIYATQLITGPANVHIWELVSS
jgi:hypothetical protein